MVHGTVFYVAYLTPILLIVCCNLIILGFVLKTLSKNPSVRKDQKMDGMTKIRVAVGCSILMGLTWIIGLLAVADLKFTFQVLFCVLNSLQGLFIFIFYCVRNQDIRKELMMRWSYKKNKYIVSEDQISREKHSKPATSSETASTLPSIVSIPFVQRTDETVHSGHVRQNKTNDIADIKTIVCTKTDRL